MTSVSSQTPEWSVTAHQLHQLFCSDSTVRMIAKDMVSGSSVMTLLILLTRTGHVLPLLAKRIALRMVLESSVNILRVRIRQLLMLLKRRRKRKRSRKRSRKRKRRRKRRK